MQPRSQGLFPILSAGRTQDREKALATRLGWMVEKKKVAIMDSRG